MLKQLTVEFEKLVNEKLARLNRNVNIKATHSDLVNFYLEVKKICSGNMNDIAILIAERITSKQNVTKRVA